MSVFKRIRKFFNIESKQDRLDRAVKSLGISPYDAYHAIRNAGVVGTAGSSTKCPVARYLKQKGEFSQDVSVTQNSVRVFEGAGAFVAFPPSVTEFIRNFDAGRYPELHERHYVAR